jgi:ribosome-associated protein
LCWEPVPRHSLSAAAPLVISEFNPLDDRWEGHLEPAEFARELVDAISEKKGSDIVLLDVREVSLLADYFIICSGDTERQVKAIVEEVRERGERTRLRPSQVEGSPGSGWMVLDYSTVIVHVFLPSERDYYQLEELWSDASLVVRIQ